MSTVSRWSFVHRRAVIALWLLALLVSFGLMGALGNRFYDSVTLPGTDSQRASTLLARTFPAVAGDRGSSSRRTP